MNGHLARGSCLAVVGLVACGAAAGRGGAQPAAAHSEYSYDDTPPQAPAPKPSKPQDKVRERATRLREAGELLGKAADFRDQGQKSLAEQYFGFAELITGPDAVADLAELFRAGAPPHMAEPTKKMEQTPPQPEAVGDSEKEAPPPPPAPQQKEYASLSGTIQIDGKAPRDDLGVVTLDPPGRGRHPLPVPRIMEQRGRKFLPHVLIVPLGSPVTFPNWDPVFHNVFSTSEAKAFDLGLYKSGEARTVVFDREGIVKLGCNLHANMAAYIVIVASPHYVVTGANGQFSFRRLEPGRYTLRAWNERSQRPVTKEVELKPGANSFSVGLTGDAPKGPQPDKFGVPRGGS
ncbi:MAG TPA: carboxypeptidase regulatory-like domain-containing protein [Haliangiales bacterium]|nr:carboxypeptidase regulatory-like domain-containing protein [Haliangiales bacterium]